MNLTVTARQAAITIGEALEATAQTAGNKPVDQSDAAAIQEAEVRATGSTIISPTGVAAAAQSAASMNTGLTRDEDKIKLTDVLSVSSLKYINSIDWWEVMSYNCFDMEA